jgi:hypothetical protein
VPDPFDEKKRFVATAAFGTEMAGKIDVLRAFRNSRLLSNVSGRKFVDLYYEKSPPIAAAIRSQGWLRRAVRMLLYPLIGFASLWA